MTLVLDFLLIILGGALVMVGADKLTDGAVDIARRFRIPEIVIGLTLVAFGTSLPEFCVSLLASVQGSPALSVGNIVGSVICNTLLVMGCAALVSPMLISRSTLRRDMPLMIFSCILLAVLALDSLVWGGMADVLGHWDGVVLLACFACFMWYVVGEARRGKTRADDTFQQPAFSVSRTVLYVVLGLAALVGGGELFVKGASAVAASMGVSEAVIGLTIVAVGTSLPELVTSVVASYKGQNGIAVGNVVGSNIFNIFWILGCCGAITELPMKDPHVQTGGITPVDFGVLILSGILLWLLSLRGQRLGRAGGALLIVAYAAYVAWLVAQA